MRISIICFSLTGYMTAEDLQKDLQGKGYTAEIYKKSKYFDCGKYRNLGRPPF